MFKNSFFFILLSLSTFFVNSQTLASDTATIIEKKTIFSSVVDWYTQHLNYATITLLMTVESSFIPFPSEAVVPPAAYSACNENSNLFISDNKFFNVFIVVLFATLGALAGALINYLLALFLGRPIIYWLADSKLGHLMLLDGEKVQKAEKYFKKHGIKSTLIGRLVPVVRHLISIPAGLVKMNIYSFVIYTTIGAFIWNVILACLGLIAHGHKNIIDKYNSELSLGILIIVVLGIIYIIGKEIRKNRKKTAL